MRGDCSIRVQGLGFGAPEIAACAARGGLLSLELELEPSGQCRCAACESTPQDTQPVLSPDEIQVLIGQAVSMGCRRCILLHNGETAYGQLQQLIDKMSTPGMQVELFTSGAGITRKMADFLCRHRVAVSLKLDSLNRDVHNRLARNESAYDTVHAALASLQQAGFGLSDNPVVAIRTAIGDENFTELPDLWRWIRSQGLDPRFQIITPRRHIHQPPTIIAPDRAKRLFEELGRIDAEEFGRHWETPPALIGRSCKRHLFACHVTACGIIFPCVGVTIPLGNIRTQRLSDIIGESEVLENLRAFQTRVKEPCRTCCKTIDCYGCRGAAYLLTGDYLAGDAHCWKAGTTEIPSLPVEVAELIPHGPTMRVVDLLVGIGERRACTEYMVKRNSPMVDAAGRLDESCYIEMIAQSLAASHGFHLAADERPLHKGLLLGVKNLLVSGEARVGDRLRIDIRKVLRFDEFSIVEGVVHHENGRLLASAEIKVWRPNDAAT
jgi:MoaA/NifB/PqqE/SkfB family radical SAM enzyme/predicted hotdog family 3-hydroxylacyl-ACP dehydratase